VCDSIFWQGIVLPAETDLPDWFADGRVVREPPHEGFGWHGDTLKADGHVLLVQLRHCEEFATANDAAI
jgi:hypothetical protein